MLPKVGGDWFEWSEVFISMDSGEFIKTFLSSNAVV